MLSLDHASGQTVLFADDPAGRVVGVVRTARMSPRGLALPVPPNAALVTRAADGAEDVLVVELLQPTYDEAAGTLSYDVRVLENYEEDGLRFLADKQTDATMPAEFGQASLFIDDCPPGEVWCRIKSNCAMAGSFGTVDHCGNDTCCGPCAHQDVYYWQDLCNSTFPDACGADGCEVIDNGLFSCFGDPGC